MNEIRAGSIVKIKKFEDVPDECKDENGIKFIPEKYWKDNIGGKSGYVVCVIGNEYCDVFVDDNTWYIPIEALTLDNQIEYEIDHYVVFPMHRDGYCCSSMIPNHTFYTEEDAIAAAHDWIDENPEKHIASIQQIRNLIGW